jgi:lipoprotein-anchoring transpeptidase ErfK/SrfK
VSLPLGAPAAWLLAQLLAAPVSAQPTSALPPWTNGTGTLGAAPLSARILKADQPLLAEPGQGTARRGSAALGARLPVFAARRGGGCAERWLAVGPGAWVCEADVDLGPLPALAADARTVPQSSDGLPWRYHFVGPNGSLGYRNIEAVDVGEPDFQLDPGFAVAVVEERRYAGQRYVRTNNGLWMPQRDLAPVNTFAFRGVELASGPVAPGGPPAGVAGSGPVPSASGEAAPAELPVAWVVVDKARVFSRPGGKSSESRARFERVTFLEERTVGGTKFVRIGESAWVASKDLRHPTLAPPPAEVDLDVGDRWIDIELATQTLVAFEGRAPVFTTLVSTGKGKQGTANATPIGVHKVWVKLVSSNMDNLEEDAASRFWRMEDVPWVQYFAKGVGLHGAFWHRSFGHVRSHGCVNLSPLDAERLFWWTAPKLPAGWTAVLPGAHDRPVVVRVR